MRRYQSLGLLRNRQLRPRKLRSHEGVERFVSTSQIKDQLLYRRLVRLRPGLHSLQFAQDDVDWQFEYFCDAIGYWLMRVIGWVLWLFQAVSRCFLPRSTWRGGTGKDNLEIKKRDDDNDDDSNDTRHLKRVNRMTYDVVGRRQWRFDQCRPFLKRRIIKRKWFLKPETRKWAIETLELYHRHVNRGFRTLCSRVGKDARICVFEADSPPELQNVFVFFGDQRTLSAQSDLFKMWFKYNEGENEIRTSCVKPDEMEGLLVYIYTLTWPINMMTGHVRCGKGKCRRKSIDPNFRDVLEMYGISLKLNREKPFQRPNSEISPLQILASYATSQEDILHDSFFHPNLQYIFCPSESGFEGQGDCHFVSEVSKARRTKRKSMNKALDLVTPPKHSSLEAEDNSNVKRSFLRLSNPFLRRIHPESISTIDRGGGTF